MSIINLFRKENIDDMQGKPIKTAKDGWFYYGRSRKDNSDCLINRKFSSPRRLVIGQSGSGKTWSLYSEIEQVIDNTDEDIIIYSDCIRVDSFVGGIKVVKVGVREDYWINPLDVVFAPIIYDANETSYDLPMALEDTVDIVLALYRFVKNSELSKPEVELLRKATKDVFVPFINGLAAEKKICDFENNPTFSDILKAIQKYKDEYRDVVNEVELITEIFVIKYPEVLNRKTNLYDEKRIIINFSNTLHDFRPFYNICFLAFIYNKMKMNNKESKYTWIYIDEGYSFISNEIVRERYYTILKRSRPLRGLMATALQFVDESDPKFMAIFNYHEMTQLFCLPALYCEIIKEILNLTDEQIYTAYNCSAGEGLNIYKDKEFKVVPVKYECGRLKYKWEYNFL